MARDSTTNRVTVAPASQAESRRAGVRDAGNGDVLDHLRGEEVPEADDAQGDDEAH